MPANKVLAIQFLGWDFDYNMQYFLFHKGSEAH